MGQLHRFNSELYDQPTWRMCSSHIIFILAPNIFLCSHKSLFTFYVLLWPDTRNKIKWNWPQSPISRVARLWKISFLFQILLFFPMGSFYWYRQAWSLPTPRTQTTPSTRPGSPTVSLRVSFFKFDGSDSCLSSKSRLGLDNDFLVRFPITPELIYRQSPIFSSVTKT